MEHAELFVDMVAQVDPSTAGFERMSWERNPLAVPMR